MGDGMSGPGWMPETPDSLSRLLAWHLQPIPTIPAACLLAAVLYSVLVLLVLFMQWRRADTRAAVRRDRAADRTNDAELVAYNEYLAGLNQNG